MFIMPKIVSNYAQILPEYPILPEIKLTYFT